MIIKDKEKNRSTKTYNPAYDEETQLLLLNMLLSDPEAFAIARSILQVEYFDDRLQPAVGFVIEHADKYQKLPSVEMVKASSGIVVEKVSEAGHHTDYLLKLVEGFCQYKAMELAILDGVDLLNTGKAGEIVERVKSAVTISLMSDLGTDYFEDPNDRLNKMKDKSGYVSTGWEALDRKLYGGFTRGGLNIFCGLSGSGKSLFLQNLAINWVLAGFNVAYVSLELSEELVAVRIDSMLTGRGTAQVLANVTETVMEIRDIERKKSPGRLFIKKLPEGGTNTNTLRAYIKELQIKSDIRIDAILIDYLDLMYPINNRIDVGDHFIKDKFVSEDIRAFMHELNVFGATASQLGRQAVGSSEYDHSHIAGGISKINTADNVFAIFSSSAMKEEGLFKIQFLKTRSASAQGQVIDLAYNTKSMRITDTAENVDAPYSRQDLKKHLANASTQTDQNQPPPNTGRIEELRNRTRKGVI